MSTLVTVLLFVALFVSSLRIYVQRRDPLSRDITLVFASVAALGLVLGLRALFGTLPATVTGAAIAALLAQPLLTLRVVHRLRPVPVWAWLAASTGYALTAPLVVILPSTQGQPVFLAAIAVFAATDVLAAFYLALEAHSRVGSARMRLAFASGASALLALALLITAFDTAIGLAVDAGPVLALAAAGLYVVAFMPPARLRMVWNAVATFEFTNALVSAPPKESPESLWSRAAALVREMTGATGVLILAGEPVRTLAIATGDDSVKREDLHLDELPAARDGQRAIGREDRLAATAEIFAAPYVAVVPFGKTRSEGAVVLFYERPSLFASDDHLIAKSLSTRALIFAERSEALAEQAALAERLTQTVHALERASHAKSDFLASMSHELRTPLSAIIGFSALMRDEPMDGDTRAVPDEWLQHIHRSGEHLLALINDVLDLTKIEAGRIELQRERFDLSSAVAESVEGLRPLAARKHLQVEVRAQAGSLVADRGRLRQILYNLLSNAIKFTPEGGRISVDADWRDGDARIVVRDTGVGIAPDDLERVFQEFSQVGDIKAREAGTGLGLALTKRLVEAHEGTITVTSEPGRGSAFEVRLPNARGIDPAPPEPVVAGRVEAIGLRTVLVIEDDPGAVRLLRTYLEPEGYEVVVATDGESGIAAAHEYRPAAIVLDVLLPGIDGWEVLRRLKADPVLRNLPVMVVTVVDERTVAMKLGATDYFLKPIRPGDLLARLSQYTFTTKVRQRNVRVLAVDDDAAAREAVVSTLRREGFDVVAAASGEEAVRLALEHPPELVICDLVMPDIDGYEVVDRLQAQESTRDATILILTGHTLSLADRERLNGKVADVVAKGDDLRSRLAEWMERAANAAERRPISRAMESTHGTTAPSTAERSVA